MPYSLTLPFPIAVKMPFWATRTFLLKIVLGFLALGVAAFLGLYLFQMGDLLAQSFALGKYEAEMEGLAKGNVGLYVEAVNHFSLEELEQSINQLGFVKVEEIRYIPISPQPLVSKTP